MTAMEKRRFLTSQATKWQYFLGHLHAEFRKDRCAEKAASLAYTSLLALVPLLTVMEFTFSSFQAFDAWKASLTDLIFENLIPELGDQLRHYLNIFSQNATTLRAAGLTILIVTALSLMGTIEGSFNLIWKIKNKRPMAMRFLLYWAILTLGPLFLGLGIFASSNLLALVLSETNHSLGGGVVLTILPLALTTAAFSLLFFLVPYRPVIFRDAIIGGLAAALFFEIAKYCFTLFIAFFPSQQIIYGAFAVIPIFFIWVYVSWLIILVGAEISKCVEYFNIDRPPDDLANKALRLLYCQLKLLSILRSNLIRGETINEQELKKILKPFGNNIFFESLNDLLEAGWIARSDKYKWVLVRSMDTIYLTNLLKITPCHPATYEVDDTINLEEDPQIHKVLKDLAARKDIVFQESLSNLLQSEG